MHLLNTTSTQPIPVCSVNKYVVVVVIHPGSTTLCGGTWYNFYDTTNSMNLEVKFITSSMNFADATAQCVTNQATLFNLTMTTPRQQQFIIAMFEHMNRTTTT